MEGGDIHGIFNYKCQFNPVISEFGDIGCWFGDIYERSQWIKVILEWNISFFSISTQLFKSIYSLTLEMFLSTAVDVLAVEFLFAS